MSDKLNPKRLVVFCDGTWNDLRTPQLTNVARLAKCVKPVVEEQNPDGSERLVRQVVYYDEGVGVASNISKFADKLVQLLGGGFGRGLDRKVEGAYRFLVLNYEPDDEIFVFGFSRGAYTARSLCGLIRKCGILRRDSFDKVPQALTIYRDKRHPNDATVVEFRQNYSQPRSAGKEDDRWVKQKIDKDTDVRASAALSKDTVSYRMMYLGLWDTVGSMGIPEKFWFSRLFNRQYQFHDTRLSSLIKSARHAVAIEENRNAFDTAPVENIHELNAGWSNWSGWDVNTPGSARFVPYNHRPYQQVWFPGDHGAVGGGNPEPGLSSAALLWIAEGAVAAGLGFDQDPRNELGIAAQGVDPMANWLINKKGEPKKGDELSIYGLVGYAPRKGPATVDEVSLTARLRWCADAAWRPSNLRVLKLGSCPVEALPPAPADFPRMPVGTPPRPVCYPPREAG